VIYERFGGLCAYTGVPLGEDWQVDHVTPSVHFRWLIAKGDKNNIDNLFPALRIVNHYKREKDLEQFRRFMLSFHLRLKKLPKKTRVNRTEKRKEYMHKVADAFGITIEKPFDGLFYFEKQKEAL
jgi:5-methylcytosine-specific restriction endonuclease McrA